MSAATRYVAMRASTDAEVVSAGIGNFANPSDAELEDFGVEIYKISEPSGVSLAPAS